jgi:hypothetical protein
MNDLANHGLAIMIGCETKRQRAIVLDTLIDAMAKTIKRKNT